MISAASIFKSAPLSRRFAGVACGIAIFGIPFAAISQPVSPAAILQELKNFRETGSVLYIAAHPDDENTALIAYLAGGRNYRTAYLSLTRGDGGQNVLGPEFGSELGVIRTQELLAARRIDGGRQFFSRAIDFGFSKDYRETLRIWNRQEVLSDMVRVIREFRPDVLITRFSPIPGGTHGHHTASTVLALEAFKLAGDPKAFPDQLNYLEPWQPKRILWNVGGFQRSESGGTNLIRIDISGTDPVSGESFDEIAGRSRSMHKTQGFGAFTGSGRSGPRWESFQLLDGEPATNDILDGVDTTWNRFSGGAEIQKNINEIIAQFNPQNPSTSVPALLKLRGELAALPTTNSVVTEKNALLDRILQNCLGLEVATTMPQAEVVPGELLKLHHTAIVHSEIPIRWIGIRYPAINKKISDITNLISNQTVSRDETIQLPASTPLTQPYWLREEGTPGMFRVDDPKLIGRPENPPAFPVEQIFEVGGQTLVISGEPLQVGTGRRLDVIPPVSLKFISGVKLFAPGASRPIEIEITAARANSAGALNLNAPADWNISPASQTFHLANVGEKKRFTFTVTAPAKPTEDNITASAKIGDATFDNERIEIAYKHIPHILLQPPARLKAVSLNLAIRGKKIGYVPGAGDSVAEALTQMGYEVTPLTGADLTTNRLKNFDAVVIGIRAFNVRTDLVAQLPALFDFVASGGNVIEQYNRPGRDLKTEQLAPYELHLSGERVTDENAAVTFLAPENPVLNTPNKITSADFAGWIQERGIYYPDRWDKHFTPILACSDAGEAPLKGGLLVAQYGKGYFVYTGLVFFRQLPAGVPGAYRLFANLVSLGK
ncbi:MAG: PIG-L family deacetylase [Limisphaerales bacterium]